MEVRPARVDEKDALVALFARSRAGMYVDQAKALRPDGLYLWVFQRNEGARRFYERHGFQLVKLTDGTENMEQEPDALYCWP